MNEDLKSEFIKKHDAFISQSGFKQRLESPDETNEAVMLKEIVTNYKENLEKMHDVSLKIQELINSSCDRGIIKLDKKYPKKINRKQKKLDKLRKKNKDYPVNVKYVNRGIAAGLGVGVLAAGATAISLVYFGTNFALMPAGLFLVNGLVSLPVAVPSFLATDFALKKLFNRNKQNIYKKEQERAIKRRDKRLAKGKDAGKEKGLMTTSFNKEDFLEQYVLQPLQDIYQNKREKLTSLKLSSTKLIKDLLDTGTNNFFDKHELLLEDFDPLLGKEKHALVTLVKSLEEKKVNIEKRHLMLQELLENPKKKRETIHVSEVQASRIEEEILVDDIDNDKQKEVVNENNTEETKKTVMR